MPSINPAQWREISPHLERALALPEGERAAWLESFRRERPDLAGLLQELLEEHRSLAREQFLESGPAPLPGELSLAGRTLGPYRLLSLIGEGGMGTVWLAERVDGRFERRVAIKFLRLAVAAQGAERFKREGHLLGRLADPHIAELMDAGITPTGEPYLVLEHVEGLPIDEHCDNHSLGVEARILLFLDVLSAVAQAHASLIVHRDLKPSNVLVRNDGQVKLLDFGIAKLLDEEGNPAAATQLTLEGGGALTLQFAAPEQVTRGAITTATDVYALGILLYLLLSGRHPAGPGPFSAAELLKAITDTAPPRASEAISAPNAESVAKSRATTPERLRRQLHGDLDTIVAKALKKSPQERYASATAFADDLHRFLKHEPIAARPDALSYRAAKFLRRNRTAAALGALILVAVIAGITGTLLQARKARLQRDIAYRERDHANRITDFVTGMFKVSDPSEARGNTVTVREVLDKASRDISSGLAKDPETEAQMMDVMGNVYFGLGLYPRAHELFQAAFDTRRRILGPENPQTLQSMSNLGRSLGAQTRYAEAEKLQRDALDIQRRVLGPEHPDTLTTMFRLANALVGLNHMDEAEQLDRQVLEIRRRVLGPEHTDTLGCMDNLAFTLMVKHDYPAAEKMQREALEIERRVQGPDHPDTLDAENRLAFIVSLQGRYPEAERLQREALEIERRVLGADHMYTIRSTLNLADILVREKHYPEAEKLFLEIRDVQKRLFGPDDPRTAITAYFLACVVLAQGRRDQAISFLQEAVDHGLVPRLALGIEKDDDLKALRGDPRFAALVARAKARAAAQKPN